MRRAHIVPFAVLLLVLAACAAHNGSARPETVCKPPSLYAVVLVETPGEAVLADIRWDAASAAAPRPPIHIRPLPEGPRAANMALVHCAPGRLTLVFEPVAGAGRYEVCCALREPAEAAPASGAAFANPSAAWLERNVQKPALFPGDPLTGLAEARVVEARVCAR